MEELETPDRLCCVCREEDAILDVRKIYYPCGHFAHWHFAHWHCAHWHCAHWHCATVRWCIFCHESSDYPPSWINYTKVY